MKRMKRLDLGVAFWLAVSFLVATSGSGVFCRYRFALGVCRGNTCCILARQASGRGVAFALPAVGQLCFCAQLLDMAAQSTDSGLMARAQALIRRRRDDDLHYTADQCTMDSPAARTAR